ncbi:HutD family protein [Thalassotalea maritima]|uniref:HutD/Ves family protein n=1 Tax=Thalassotalea maritima TaxID=3242416 RepID=UPI0035299C6F
MTIDVINPNQYQTKLWKNGKGQTIELAMNSAGCDEQFDWRISSATVSEEGIFSDFSGYHRHMVLIEGYGLTLSHDNGQIDQLNIPLDVASFDGGWQTNSKLATGTIKNINLMTNKDSYMADVQTFVVCQQQPIKPADLVFVISLADGLALSSDDSKANLTQFSLATITHAIEEIIVSGQQVIVFRLTQINR